MHLAGFHFEVDAAESLCRRPPCRFLRLTYLSPVFTFSISVRQPAVLAAAAQPQYRRCGNRSTDISRRAPSNPAGLVEQHAERIYRVARRHHHGPLSLVQRHRHYSRSPPSLDRPVEQHFQGPVHIAPIAGRNQRITVRIASATCGAHRLRAKFRAASYTPCREVRSWTKIRSTSHVSANCRQYVQHLRDRPLRRGLPTSTSSSPPVIRPSLRG